MKVFKKIIFVIVLIWIILWSFKFTSDNLRIEGYWGLFFEWKMPKHDTQFAENYSDKKFLAVKKGMTEQEVFDILGEPIETWKRDENSICFAYSKSPGKTHYRLRQLIFADSIVIEKIGYYYVD